MRGVVILTLTVCCLASPVARAWHYYSTSMDEMVHWPPGDCTFTYYIDSDGIPEVEEDTEIGIINEQVDKWNALECTVMHWTFAGLLDDADAAIDNTNVVLFVEQDWVGYAPEDAGDISGWVAFTWLTFMPDTGEIFDADLLVNLDHFTYADCSGAPEDVGKIDLAYTILHEWGHMYGLAHSGNPDAVMQPEARRCEDEIPLELMQDDIDGLCWFYGKAQWNEDCLNPAVPEPEPDVTVQDIPAFEDAVPDVTPDVEADTGQGQWNCVCTVNGAAGRTDPAGMGALLGLILLAYVRNLTNRRARARRSFCRGEGEL